MKSSLLYKCLLASYLFLSVQVLNAEEAAYQIEENVVSVAKLYKEDADKFYKLEKEKYETISKVAEEKYFEYYWAKLAKQQGVEPEVAKEVFFQKNLTVSDKQIKKTLEKFKGHPRIKNLSLDVQKMQVADYLKAIKAQEIQVKIINEAKKNGEFTVLYPSPKEPRYSIEITAADPIRYGPKASDIKPLGCSTDCKVTIVEYSEFECPYCIRVQETLNKVLAKFKGKVRLIARDYPLDFHDRAKPAAIAARCAQNQGKYWQMSELLYSNKSDLSDAYIEKSGLKIGLNMKSFKACLLKPVEALKRVDVSFASGRALGVSGTPVFFINGKKVSGILSFSEFEKVIKEEIAKIK